MKLGIKERTKKGNHTRTLFLYLKGKTEKSRNRAEEKIMKGRERKKRAGNEGRKVSEDHKSQHDSLPLCLVSLPFLVLFPHPSFT